MRKFGWLFSLLLPVLVGCSSGSVQILSVTAVSPTNVVAGTATTVTVTGQQFTSRTGIQVGSTVLPTTLVSSTQMSAALPAAIVNTAGTYPVSVVDSEPVQQGGTAVLTTAFSITVTNATPVIASASPTLLLAGQTGASVAVTGSGFLPSTTATLNGVTHAIAYQDAQHLTLALNAADLLYAQNLTLLLTNGAPGGGTSAAVTLQVTNYTKAAQQYSAYGDSITYGYQLKAVTSAYPYLLAAANTLQLTDLARIGDQACDTFTPLSSRGDGYAAQPNTIFSYMIGTNDTYVKGSGAYESVFNACDQAVVSWLALPASAKVQPGSTALQYSGGCGAVPDATHYGVARCTSAGAVSAQSFVTYGAPLYLWVLVDDTAPANASMQITGDGVTSGTYPVATTPAIATMNHATSSIELLRVPVAAGTHAVTFTSNAGSAGLLAIGTVPKSRAGLPPVVVGDVPNQLTYAPYAPVAVQLAYSADVRANVALLQSDGLDIRFAPDRDFMLGSSTEMVDALHPNELGQQHLQAAFQTGFVALNASGGLVAQLASGVTPLPAQALVAVMPRTSGGHFLISEESSGLVTISNRSAESEAVIDLPIDERTTGGASSFVIPPGQTVTLQKLRSDAGVQWGRVRTSGVADTREELLKP